MSCVETMEILHVATAEITGQKHREHELTCMSTAWACFNEKLIGHVMLIWSS